MFQSLGRLSASHPWLVCILWLAAGIALARHAPHWDTRTQDDDIRFVPDRFTSVRAYQLLEKAFPQDVFASKLVFAVEREDRPLSDADFRLVDHIIADLEKLRQDAPDLKISKIDSYQDSMLGWRLTSADRQCTLIQVALGTPYLALSTMAATEKAQEVVEKRLATVEGPPNLYATGAAGIGRDLMKAAGTSLDQTTVATVILVVVVLLLVYRAPLLAMVPLCTIALSVWVALNLLALMTLLPGVHLVNISKIFAIVILYGAGTDYCLFLISRYQEELREGKDTIAAIAGSVGGVGEALAASAGTVMVGLGLMALAEFAKVRYAGPAIALSLGVALAASLTLTPALLSILGRTVFWPRPAPQALKKSGADRKGLAEQTGLWDWISLGVVKRPLLVWMAALAVLSPLVWIGLKVEPNYRATGELTQSSQSLTGLAALQRHFTAGEIGPVTVLLTSAVDWNTREGRLEIDQLSRGFAGLPNVAEVRSLTQPLGVAMPDLTPRAGEDSLWNRVLVALQPTLSNFLHEMQSKACDHYLARIQEETPEGGAQEGKPQAPVTRHIARLDVVLKSDPFDPTSAETLKLIQTWLDSERPRSSFLECQVQSECYGVTATAVDLADLTESDRARVNTLVLIAIFAILLLLVRRIWLAGYLLVTVLLSYYASLGATVLVATLWNGGVYAHQVEWRVPFFLFTILVAVGEDYNILLITRAMEERKRFGAVEGMRRALARTGGAITSCGLIMAGTFATLMLAGLGTLLQIGFALAFGVLIDTFIVRPFLVPAFVMIFWRSAELEEEKEDPADKEAEELERILWGDWQEAA